MGVGPRLTRANFFDVVTFTLFDQLFVCLEKRQLGPHGVQLVLSVSGFNIWSFSLLAGNQRTWLRFSLLSLWSLTSSALPVLSLTFGDWKDREKINCPNIDPLYKVGATWVLATCRKADNPPLAAGNCHVVLSWRPVITSLAVLMTHIQNSTESPLGLRVQWWWLIQTLVWALILKYQTYWGRHIVLLS